MTDVRQYTNKILEMVDEGLLDRDNVILACLNFMSDSDVKEMAEINEFAIFNTCEECGDEIDENTTVCEDCEHRLIEDEIF